MDLQQLNYLFPVKVQTILLLKNYCKYLRLQQLYFIVGHHQIEVVQQELNIYDLDKGASAHQIFDRMITRESGSIPRLLIV